MYYWLGPFTIFWFIKSHFPELDLQPYCVLMIFLCRLSMCLRKPALLFCESPSSSCLTEGDPVRARGIKNTGPLGRRSSTEGCRHPLTLLHLLDSWMGEACPDFREAAGYLLIPRLPSSFTCVFGGPGCWPAPSRPEGRSCPLCSWMKLDLKLEQPQTWLCEPAHLHFAFPVCAVICSTDDKRISHRQERRPGTRSCGPVDTLM